MVFGLILALIKAKPGLVVGAVLIPWSLQKGHLRIPRVGTPTLIVLSYMWGYKRGQLRYRARKRLLDVAQVRELDEATLRALIGELPAWVKFPDYDRAMWLNNMTQNWWPCLSTAICRTVKFRLQSLLQKKKPDLFSSIVLETFSLGSLPPRCSGAKVYNTNEEEIILDLEMTWAATNADIVLSVRLAQGTVALPVQLSQVLFQGTVRLIFKPLVPQWPCFGAISVAFVGKPQVDFSLRLIGGELMSVPGLAPALHDLLKNRLLSSMVWPRRVYAPILKHLKHNQGKEAFHLQPKASGLLRTHLIQAKGLRNHELSVVFATLELGGVIRRSEVFGSASEIVFDDEEVLNFIVQHPDFEALRVTFYEVEAQNTFDAQLMSPEELTNQLRLKVERDEFEMDPEVAVRRIGEGIMPTLSVPSRKTVDVWLELGEGNGQVHVDFQYVSFGEEPLGAEVELELSTPMPSLRASLLDSAGININMADIKPHNLMPSYEGANSSSDSIESMISDTAKNGGFKSGAQQKQDQKSKSKQEKKKKKEKKKNKRKGDNNNKGKDGDKGKKLAVRGAEMPAGQRSAHIGVLYVSLQEARGLVNSDWSGLCSAFVRFVAGSSRYESTVASKSLVPTWKENFELIISDTRECKNVRIEVWDQVSDFIGLFGSSREFIGKTEIPLKSLLDSKATSNEWPVYGNDLNGEIQTGQVIISFQWIGVPLSPFYVTPSLNPQRNQRYLEVDRRQRSPSTTEYVKITGKRLVLKVIRICILSLLLVTLLIVLIMPSLRVGAGQWLQDIIHRPALASKVELLRNLEWWWVVNRLHYLWIKYSTSFAFKDFKDFKEALNWKLLQWLAAEAMLVAAVLLTVKLILWADKNGIVSALMQPPWKWFDLDKVRDEFNERQEHKKKPTGINQNGTAHLNGAGAALTTT
eukprot:CAMPEP_0197471170 /NCGR_PEP_ID=MMETSP1309-20131121/2062_1 /TAXON_ID=464262 /ORGANISM="Genus nov. species nov., Strain RCC998" /LENGTH=919 /DNA_ID=CAMNT_0043008679 /DNA_START=78 /DNA_END=2837 /DNA_ORIENTATION=+